MSDANAWLPIIVPYSWRWFVWEAVCNGMVHHNHEPICHAQAMQSTKQTIPRLFAAGYAG